MKFIFLISVLLFGFVADEQLQFDASSVKWTPKTKSPDEVINQVYRFKNVSDGPVKIVEVRPSCTCTTPDFSKGETASGKTGFVTLSTTARQLRESHKVDAVIKTSNTKGQKRFYKIELIYGAQ